MRTMSDLAIILSGLPASGKTTTGRALAAALGLPVLDKDDVLEALFAAHGIGGSAWRQRLSRRADRAFQADTLTRRRVVLISHWRPAGAGATGTPTAWLAAFARIVEVHCPCPPDRAAARFLARQRHPGHLDRDRDPAEIRAWMHRLAPGYPLGIGPVITAADPVDIALLARRLGPYLAG